MTRAGLAFLPICIAVVAAGCQSVPVRGSAHPDFEAVVTDTPEAKRFEITLTNRSASRTLCLDVDEWPDQEGKLGWGQDRVWVRIGSHAHFLEAWNPGYCPEGCVQARVSPGQVVTAFIRYDDFEGFEDADQSAVKDLHFEPIATWCAPS